MYIASREISARHLHWRHNGHDGVSNHQPRDCLLNRWFRRRLKKTSKLRVTGLCEFPARMASNAESVSIWWRRHGIFLLSCTIDVTDIFQNYFINNGAFHFKSRKMVQEIFMKWPTVVIMYSSVSILWTDNANGSRQLTWLHYSVITFFSYFFLNFAIRSFWIFREAFCNVIL